VFVPYALAQVTVVAEVDGLRGTLAESQHRIAPHCRYFSHCGGCAVQTLAAPSYGQWKRELIARCPAPRGLASEVMDLVDAHGRGADVQHFTPAT
jgi:23S rRNA (uracil1939-C5)-methyltransferase